MRTTITIKTQMTLNMKTILQCYRRSLTEALLVLVAAVNAQGQYTYTTLSAPGASETFAYGIYGNNIVGEDYTGSGNYGFLYNAVSGTYTTLSVPGAVQTAAYGISGNNIVGWYNPGGPNTEGFLYNTISQTYTTLNVPGALMTRANGIDGDNITLWSTSGAFLYKYGEPILHDD